MKTRRSKGRNGFENISNHDTLLCASLKVFELFVQISS